MKLIKLPSGDWIRTDVIKSIHVCGANTKPGEIIYNPPRVEIGGGETLTVVHCDSVEHAQDTADQIAALVNHIGGAQ